MGQTPKLEFGTRDEEIVAYMSEMRDTEYEVKQFVIIDDEEEMSKLEPHLSAEEKGHGCSCMST